MMSVSRRKFVAHAAFGMLGGAALSAGQAVEAVSEAKRGEMPSLVSTWSFGQTANDAGLKVLLQGGSILDAVEQGIWVVESSNNGSVGLSGGPNAAGVVQLDACIMSGPGHRAGSVAALEGIRHPISAARRVMEKTRHVMLVGEGARLFALEQGLESVEINSSERYRVWQEERRRRQAKPFGDKPDKSHDTIALLVLGTDGSIAGGCSTSGLGGKLPGRVGDSPIIGSGLYVDNDTGAAGATGLGENIMRYCGSFMVVEYMRQGRTPTEACQETIRRIMKHEGTSPNLSINFVALDKFGRCGGVGTDAGFSYSVTTPSNTRVLPNAGLGKS